jgi:hypothetical protein
MSLLNSFPDTDSLGAARFRDWNSARPWRKRQDRLDYAVVFVCVCIIAFLSVIASKPVIHWFLLPVIACGILSGVDIVRWLRGRLDLFDPKVIIAFLSFYGCFITPMLHVIWDRFGVNNDLPLWGDWRPWLGAMAALNTASLLIYRIAHNYAFNRTRPSTLRWEIDRKKFHFCFSAALVCSVAGVYAFFSGLDGISGMVKSFEENLQAYTGKGWLLVFAWPLAVLCFIVIVYLWTNRKQHHRRPATIGILLVGTFGVCQFILMGWYGSRSATIWALFWMAGIIHYRIDRLSRKMVAIGIILLIAFMYFYGFYKEQGRTGFGVIDAPSTWLQPKGYKRDIKFLLLEDLARADVNAYILYNLIKFPTDYQYRWGLTYAGAPLFLVPRNFWPNRPNYKTDAGTEATLGKSSSYYSTRVYGITGEALLNFGPWGVLPMFALYGAGLGWYRKKLKSWDGSDARMFLAPLLTILFASVFVSDSDNILYLFVVDGSLITAALLASVKKIRLSQIPPWRVPRQRANFENTAP